MARPRKLTLSISDLKCFNTIVSELETMETLNNFNIDEAILTVKERKQPYTAKPENIASALKLLKEYVAGKDLSEPIDISKQEMSNILSLSRPTIDQWIKAGVIQSEVFGTYLGRNLHIFTLRSILKGLESISNK